MATRTQNRATVAASGLSSKELLKIIQQSIKPGDILPQGDGWKSISDYCKEWSLGREQTGKLLRHGARLGLLEHFKGKVGRNVTMFYRPIQ